MTYTKVTQVREEARRRGMQVVGHRHYDRAPSYSVWIGWWNSENLQALAGDTTPEVHGLCSRYELLAWANTNWSNQ